MITKDYIKQALYTESNDWPKILERYQNLSALGILIDSMNKTVGRMGIFDVLKRFFYYGKTPTGVGVFPPLDCEMEWSDYPGLKERLQDVKTLRLLHAVIGLCTELGELVEATVKHVFDGEELDVVNVLEECGDLDWYFAMLHAVLGLDPEEVMSKNIAKLKARYPEKFSEAKALTRDLETERRVLEELAGTADAEAEAEACPQCSPVLVFVPDPTEPNWPGEYVVYLTRERGPCIEVKRWGADSLAAHRHARELASMLYPEGFSEQGVPFSEIRSKKYLQLKIPTKVEVVPDSGDPPMMKVTIGEMNAALDEAKDHEVDPIEVRIEFAGELDISGFPVINVLDSGPGGDNAWSWSRDEKGQAVLKVYVDMEQSEDDRDFEKLIYNAMKGEPPTKALDLDQGHCAHDMGDVTPMPGTVGPPPMSQAPMASGYVSLASQMGLPTYAEDLARSGMIASRPSNKITEEFSKADVLAEVEEVFPEIRVVFDGPPGPESGRFVEVENAYGRSIKVGEWVEGEGNTGLWELRIPMNPNHPHLALGKPQPAKCPRPYGKASDGPNTPPAVGDDPGAI